MSTDAGQTTSTAFCASTEGVDTSADDGSASSSSSVKGFGSESCQFLHPTNSKHSTIASLKIQRIRKKNEEQVLEEQSGNWRRKPKKLRDRTPGSLYRYT